MKQLSGMFSIPQRADWQSSEPWIAVGKRVVYFMLGGFVVLSWAISISGAVVSAGTVTVESNYKAVQHFEGGIVSRVLVKNGDRVEQGEVVVKLDDTAARANLAVVRTRIIDLAVQEARLEAERAMTQSFELSGQLGAIGDDPEVHKIYMAQKALFDARLASRLGEQAVLEQRSRQSEAELKGLRAQLNARQRERDLNHTELANVKPLFDKGFANQQRLGALERDAARLEGEVGRLQSEIARSTGAVAEAGLRLAQSTKEFIQSVVDEMRKVQAQLAELRENRSTLKDKLDRTEIKAPRAGRVHALVAHTEGGVVAPGTQVMQIIPEGERLVVEAQIAPQDIDKVRLGLAAAVRFPAFNAHTTPRVSGSVGKVSAAQLTDPQGRTYFLVEIDIPATELSRLGPGHRLVPGMPAEVFIETSSRSILSYLLKPLGDAMTRSFRES